MVSKSRRNIESGRIRTFDKREAIDTYGKGDSLCGVDSKRPGAIAQVDDAYASA
jgi:hypothetical protein